MPNSVLDAIKLGVWDYEPEPAHRNRYEATDAMPGTDRKLEILADRLQRGLPLWHPEDRECFDAKDE